MFMPPQKYYPTNIELEAHQVSPKTMSIACQDETIQLS